MQGRIVRITTETEVILNLGEADGVYSGMAFGVYTPPVDVFDPDTGESLGAYSKRKAILEATVVEPRFCVAGPRPQSFRILPGALTTAPGRLSVNPKSLEPLPTGETIAVGDEVRSFMSEDEREFRASVLTALSSVPKVTVKRNIEAQLPNGKVSRADFVLYWRGAALVVEAKYLGRPSAEARKHALRHLDNLKQALDADAAVIIVPSDSVVPDVKVGSPGSPTFLPLDHFKGWYDSWIESTNVM